MNFQQVEFEMSAGVSSQNCPGPMCRRSCFPGKSNVGKSSLINKLVNRKALARVSATPGKTTTINFFRLPPGTAGGLARVWVRKSIPGGKKALERLMEGYFAAGRPIATVVQILDYRHAPTAEDQNMLQFLIEQDIPLFGGGHQSGQAQQNPAPEATGVV